MRIFKKIVDIKNLQTYILSLIFFYMIIMFVPLFNNQFLLPKLIVLQIGTSLLLFTKAAEIILMHKRDKPQPFVLILFFLFIVNAVSLVHSVSPSISFWGNDVMDNFGFYFLLQYIVVAVIYSNLDKKQKNIVKITLVLGTFISSLYSIYQYFNPPGLVGITQRPIGLEGQPIWTSGIIGIGLLLMPIVDFTPISQYLNYFGIKIFIAIIHLVALWYLDSVTTWLSLTAAIIGACIIFLWQKKRSLKLKIIAIFILGCFGVLLLVTSYNHKTFSVSKRILELKSTYWLLTKEIFSQQHTLTDLFFGRGQAMSGYYLLKYRSPDENYNKEWFANTRTIHNQYFELLFTTGVFGLFVWISIMIFNLYHRIKQKQTFGLLVPLFLISWQMLYMMLPTIAVVSYLVFFDYDLNISKKSLRINLKNRFFNYLLALIFIFIGFWFIYNTYRTIRAELYYVNKQYKNALDLAVSKDIYRETYLQTLSDTIGHCTPQSKFPIPACSNVQILLQEAFKESNNYITSNPMNPTAWTIISQVYFLRHLVIHDSNNFDLKKALDAQLTVNRMDPTDPIETENLALLYLEYKDYVKAEKYFLIANQLLPNNTITINHLIELYKQINMPNKVAYYQNKLTISVPMYCSQQTIEINN